MISEKMMETATTPISRGLTREQIADETLIRSVLDGNVAQFDLLVERYFGLVFAIAFARLSNREAAEDLTQETFLRIYLNLPQLRNPQIFGGWVARVARNLATDWQRRGQTMSRI